VGSGPTNRKVSRVIYLRPRVENMTTTAKKT
jgi:hypothetical protein